MKYFHWLGLATMAVVLSGCSPQEPQSNPNIPPVPPGAKAYDVRGIVREFRPTRKHAFIEHEEIPGFMMAMTMLLEVQNTNEFNGIEIGDQITFRMLFTDDDHWIDQVKKTGLHFEPDEGPLPSERQNPPLEIEEGDRIPDITLTNELGHTVTLDRLQGKVIAFTYFFTRCPVPDFCPLMSKNFSEAAQILASQGNLPSNWKLLSISFDPENDTAEKLREYAGTFDYDPNHWSFLTGPIEEVDRWGKPLGLFHNVTAETIEHNLRTVILDQNLRIQEIFIGNEWTPQELAASMIKLLKAGE